MTSIELMPFHIIKHGRPRHRKKLAMFDMDWTLVKPHGNRTFPKDAKDWQWLKPFIVDVVKRYYDQGYAIVIVTNQSKPWKKDMVSAVMEALTVPCTALIAFDKAFYKPDTRMFHKFVENKTWDKDKSFFVGDALGRAADFANTDRLFAEALGIRVFAPEDVFKAATGSEHKEQKNSTSAIAPVYHQEVVIMVGYPGSGKSTVVLNTFGHLDRYMIINGDEVKTVAKMLKLGKSALEASKSVVFDATNGTKERRALYIALAKELNVPVRCIHVNTTMEEAIERNNAREREKGVPKLAYYTYRKRFQQPTEDEGFTLTVI